jgi:hypothetical protein
MITVPTVLILGAGASMHLKFPSGEELKNKICHRRISANAAQDHLDFPLNDIMKFIDALKRSGKTSVDEFLEHRPAFLGVGKACIARELIPCEQENNLFNFGDWYQYLFGKLNASFEEFGNNKLSIITYNYDRSLEQFLFNALKHSYGKEDAEVAQQLKIIPIIHLHGKLDDLPWQNNNGRPYAPSLNNAFVKTSSASIKIISENIINDPEFIEAHKALAEAKFIYFLGFGYNETNLKRLDIHKIANKVQKISGSSRGFSTLEKHLIEVAWNERPNVGAAQKIDLSKYNRTVLEFLREEVNLH